MFGLFGTRVSYDDKKDIVTVSGNFGSSFKRRLERDILKKKYDKVFIDSGRFSFSYYAFFELEVVGVLKYIIESGKYKYGINHKNLATAITAIQTRDRAELRMSHHIDTTRLSTMVFQPLPFQSKIFKEYTLKKQQGLLGEVLTAAVGSGKTYMSVALSVALGYNTTIIVVPKNTIITTWIPSLREDLFKNDPGVLTSIDITNGVEYDNQKFILVHNEFLPKLLNFCKDNRIIKPMLIVDEVHGFTDIKSDRTNLLLEVSEKLDVEDVILMSGTAIKAKVREMLPFIILLERRFTKHISKRLIEIYKNPNWMINMIAPERFDRYSVHIDSTELKLPPLETEVALITLKDSKQYTLESIKIALQNYIEETKKELIKDKPRQDSIYLELREVAFNNCLDMKVLSKEDIDTYKKNVEIIVTNYKNGSLMLIPDTIVAVNVIERKLRANLPNESKKAFDNAKTFYKYLDLKVQGMALANVVLKTRIKAFTAIADSLNYAELYSNTTRKTIYYSSYVAVCEAITDGVRRDTPELRPCKVYGEFTKDLSSEVKRFTKGDAKDTPIIATYLSLSTGVNGLQFVSDYIITIDLPYREAVLTQALGRARRTGQTGVVTHLQIQLDTGDEKNIADRGVDILKITGTEAARITGVESTLDVGTRDGVTEIVMEEDGFSSVSVNSVYFNLLEDAGYERYAIEDAIETMNKQLSWAEKVAVVNDNRSIIDF